MPKRILLADDSITIQKVVELTFSDGDYEIVTANNGAFDSGFVFTQSGSTYERVFTAADENRTFEYRCVSHQGCCQMQGSVRVGTGAPDPGPGY